MKDSRTLAEKSLTAKAKNKLIRQEALREQLSNQGHIQHVIDILIKLADVDQQIDKEMHDRYKTVINTKLKFIDKYLPTEKPTTHTGEDGGPIAIQVQWLQPQS